MSVTKKRFATDETLKATNEQLSRMNASLAAMASKQGGFNFDNFDDINFIVRMGAARSFFAVADQIEIEKETSLTIGIGSSTGITVATINAATFLAAMGTAHSGIYEAHYDGQVWHREDESNINLATYGIEVTGTPAEGDHIVVSEATSKTLYDIVEFDPADHAPKDTRLTHTLMMLAHNVVAYGTMPFSAPQLLYYATNGLPAGNYKFTLNKAAYGSGNAYNGTYMFTLTQAIPSGGGFRHSKIGSWQSSYAQSDVTGNRITTYAAITATASGAAVESSVAVSVWDETTECVDLGTFTASNRSYYSEDCSVTIDGTTYTGKRNFTERNAYGSNRWKTSVYRQWLNSAAGPATSPTVSNWWTPQTVFDRVPGGAANAGYLYGMDPEFVNAVGEVAVKTALHPCDRTGDATTETTYDKFFLLSRKEVYNSDEFSGVSEGTVLSYFNGAANKDRIKYQSGTARYWWLRTPYSGGADSVRGVNTYGSLFSGDAYIAYGVVPACCVCGHTITKTVA